MDLKNVYMDVDQETLLPKKVYLVMSHCGCNLNQYMDKRDLELDSALDIVSNIARGLHVSLLVAYL